MGEKEDIYEVSILDIQPETGKEALEIIERLENWFKSQKYFTIEEDSKELSFGESSEGLKIKKRIEELLHEFSKDPLIIEWVKKRIEQGGRNIAIEKRRRELELSSQIEALRKNITLLEVEIAKREEELRKLEEGK